MSLVTSIYLQKKGLQRSYFLRRLKSFNVHKNPHVFILQTFNKVQFNFCFNIPYNGKDCVQNKNHLSKTVKEAGRITGVQQLPLTIIFDGQVLQKTRSILSSSDHPVSVKFIA